VSETAIRVEGLGKRYRIGTHQPYYTLRESLTKGVAAPIRWFENIIRNGNNRLNCTGDANRRSQSLDPFVWALKDVSFTIDRGQVVGVIGRNGAGKSTLLKILTRITPPTEGEAEVFGRVGSLLEVGTGFHPELTGRENIFVNGAILGMKMIEIERKFDAIVEFAEVEKFIDTPVKRYSSGLYMRLAFAVAVHLEPEILLVDEVLAVGDIEFQRRCIGKMEKVAGDGKTVILVSHSMSTVKALCTKAILLEQGGVKCIGSVEGVVSEYLQSRRADPSEKVLDDDDHEAGGGRAIRLKRIKLLGAASSSFSVFWKQPISVSLEIEVLEDLGEVSFGAALRTLDGTFVFVVYNDEDGRCPWSLQRGQYTVDITVQNSLRPGLYRFHVGGYQRYARLKNLFAIDAVNLEVLEFTEQGTASSIRDPGLVGGVSSVFSHKISSRCDGQNR
jgi:lipopolysaccharide transport system ATP-binding protein